MISIFFEIFDEFLPKISKMLPFQKKSRYQKIVTVDLQQIATNSFQLTSWNDVMRVYIHLFKDLNNLSPMLKIVRKMPAFTRRNFLLTPRCMSGLI